MAYVEMVFAGLMLVCLDGQSDCPKYGTEKNTAWVLKATKDEVVCGWQSYIPDSIFTVSYSKNDFDTSPGYKWVCCGSDTGIVKCTPGKKQQICTKVEGANSAANVFPYDGKTFGTLPRLEEVDLRFKSVNSTYLNARAPTTLSFPFGSITANDTWPPAGAKVSWERSNGGDSGSLPSYLADRLKINFVDAKKVVFHECGKDANVYLELKLLDAATNASIEVKNQSDGGFSPEKNGKYYKLPYVLWYYSLGNWGGGLTKCPDYYKKKPVVLRCKGESKKGVPCSCYIACDADGTYWPVFVHPDH